MASNASRSPVHREPGRQRLTSAWTLLGIAIAVGVTLVLIFPGRGLLTQSAKQRADELSLAYLSDLARREPNNAELRFTLAEKQTEAGRIAEARAALEPLLESIDPAVRQRARLEDFKLRMREMQALPERSAARITETDRLREALAAMSHYEWSTAALLEFAQIANELGAHKLKADLYLRIARGGGPGRTWTDEAARTLLGEGEYTTAAEIYFAALRNAQTRADQRHYFMSGLKALQAGNLMRELMMAADRHIGPLADDDETLRALVRLALLANDLPRAQTYAKKLLRMSRLQLVRRWLAGLADYLVRVAYAAGIEQAAQPLSGMRPYDAADYQLAYDVFLASRNLHDAYRVAAAAVYQVPAELRWRERLAQAAEWTERPNEALQQWLFIARRTGRPEAWNAVLRLAPGLFEDEALLEAMRYHATRTNLSDAQWRAVVDAFERVGRPREGATFLEREYARRPRVLLLELQAELMERTGDLDGAIAAWRRVIERAGATTRRMTTLATLLIVKGDYREAYRLLDAHRGAVAQDDAAYWRLLADVAWQLQEDTGAERALGTLIASSKATADDWSRLVTLLNARDPVAAARLAELGYERFKTPAFLALALQIHRDRRDFTALHRIFSNMTPEMIRAVESDPDLLLVRAEYRAATGRTDLACADYRAALKIDPDNRFARIALMWLLVDRRDVAALRREIPAATARAKDDAAFQGVLGAAWLVLDDPARAVAYFGRVLKANPDDYLWLLNYADALEQNNQAEMAWRVRRHAWVKVREAKAGIAANARPPLELLQAEARLALQELPGDAGLAVMRNLLRQDEGMDAASAEAGRRGLDAGTRELVLSWLISTEDWIGAKAWLWKQYARNLAKPAWAEIRVAIAENDVETMQRLLEHSADTLPRHDRHEAARRTQQLRLAQDIAFRALERVPHDDDMHGRLTQSVLDTASSAEVGVTHYQRGLLSGREWIAEIGVWTTPRLRLSLDLSVLDQHTIDPGVLTNVPGRDALLGVSALFRHAIGETRFSVFHRDALADTTGFRASHQRPLGPRTTARVGYAHNERPDETSALSAGGQRNRLFAGLEYTLSKREYVLAELFASRYYTQERTFIGSGYGMNWEVGHRFRVEYPDLNVRLAGSINHFDHSGRGDVATSVLVPDGTVPTAAFFLPPSFAVYGVYTGFGTSYQTSYTRGVRPFADVGLNHNTVTGAGYSALLGLSGTLTGKDWLMLYALASQGGDGTGLITREIGMRYRYLFDRF